MFYAKEEILQTQGISKSVLLFTVELSSRVPSAPKATSPELCASSIVLIVGAVSRHMPKLLTDKTGAIHSSHRKILLWRSLWKLGSTNRSHWEVHRHWGQKLLHLHLLRVLKNSRVST